MILKIISVWLLAAMICSPMFILGILNPQNVYFKRVCAPNHSNFKLYGSIFAFYVPLLIIIIAYVFTLKSLKKLMKTKNSASSEKACTNSIVNGFNKDSKQALNRKTVIVYYKSSLKKREMVVEETLENKSKLNTKINSVNCHDRDSSCLNCVNKKKVTISEEQKFKSNNRRILLKNRNILKEFQLEPIQTKKCKKRISFNLSSNANDSTEVNKSEPEENPSQQISPISFNTRFGNELQFMFDNKTKSFNNNCINPIRKSSFLSTAPNNLSIRRNTYGDSLSEQQNPNMHGLMQRKKHSIFSLTENWSNHSNIRISKVKNERKALKVLIIIFIVFVCLWSPFFLLNTFSVFCKSDKCIFLTQNVLMPITWLGYISSMVNPIIYTMFSNNFRKAVFNLLKCKTVNPNLQRSIYLAYRSKSFCDSKF